MPRATINGIDVHYETYGSGPALLMSAPGGFDSTVSRWSAEAGTGVWAPVRPLEVFSERYTCIAYDRRESGESGGRVEKLSWRLYVEEGVGLLDHLGIDKAFVLGGCMGCSFGIAFGVLRPERTSGLLLHWPAGGYRWRSYAGSAFEKHADFVKERGLDAVVRHVRSGEEDGFLGNPAPGPWGNTIKNSDEFARDFAQQDPDRYAALVRAAGASMFDRDTAPGAEAEELLALRVPTMIIPGNDFYHATSAAVYLRECIEGSVYHDGPVEGQTPDRIRGWVLDFLDEHSAAQASNASRGQP